MKELRVDMNDKADCSRKEQENVMRSQEKLENHFQSCKLNEMK